MNSICSSGTGRKYYDLANVVGGLITVEDNAEGIRLLKEEYEICRKDQSLAPGYEDCKCEAPGRAV